ncbi:cell division protein ZapA [Halanaerocella petrolearia]
MGDSENKSEVKVDILGEEYIIKGNKSSDYISNIASFLDNHLRKVKEYNPSISRMRVMILGAMNLADRLHTTQDKHQNLQEKYNQVVGDYQKKIEEYNQLEDKYEKLKAEYDDLVK